MDAVESPVVPWNDRRIDASTHEFCDTHRMMNKILEAYLLLRIFLLIFCFFTCERLVLRVFCHHTLASSEYRSHFTFNFSLLLSASRNKSFSSELLYCISLCFVMLFLTCCVFFFRPLKAVHIIMHSFTNGMSIVSGGGKWDIRT